jgi:hypothetical protein
VPVRLPADECNGACVLRRDRLVGRFTSTPSPPYDFCTLQVIADLQLDEISYWVARPSPAVRSTMSRSVMS